MESATHREVQRYYGETLESSADLKTTACCTATAPPDYAKQLLAGVHPEVLQRYYGCGLVLPEALDGLRVLDLGCGAGRDVYVLSALVGEHGSVVGVDMTPAQLEVARRYQDHHAELYGHTRSNVEFLEGNIEALNELNLPDASFDLIVSNCVINLAVDKHAVLSSALRLLKPGGEMYFSDIYADRRVPAELAADPVLYGECLSGAMYWKDFLNLSRDCGFAEPLLVTDETVDLTDPELLAKVGPLRFYSATYRLFRVEKCEAGSEDYGQTAVYRGTIPNHPDEFRLDSRRVFKSGAQTGICGNTFRLLKDSRFSAHFELLGDDSVHIGSFDAESQRFPFKIEKQAKSKGSCC